MIESSASAYAARRRVWGLRAAVLLAAASSVLSLPVVAPAATGAADERAESESEGALAGRTLPEALERLRERGLRIVYSTSVVRADMRVESEPVGEEPRALLEQIVDPHGLAVRPGPGGRLLVVRRVEERHGTISGWVESESGEPLADVVVDLPERGIETKTDREGRFAFPEVPVGRERVRVVWGEGAPLTRTVEVEPDQRVELVFRVVEMPTSEERIDVISRLTLLGEEPTSGVSLDRADINALPHFGDDLYRAFNVLPGVVNDDFTAGINVRGDLDDEVLVRVDGLELYEPYHLKDFKGLFSILDPRIMGGVDLIPGSFPAEFGDRSSSVLDMTTLRPHELRGEIGASFSGAWLSGAGLLGDRGHWLGSARRGYLDLILELSREADDGEETPDPTYWDVFGKADFDLGSRHALAINTLVAGDTLRFAERDIGEATDVVTDSSDGYVWLGHRWAVTDRAFAETVVSVGGLEHERDAVGTDVDFRGEERFTVRDDRTVDLLGLRQDWTLEVAGRHRLKAGFEARSFDVSFDYRDDIEREDPIGDPRFELPEGVDATLFVADFDGEHSSAWLSDRFDLGDHFTAEVGVRWDRQTLVGEEQVSPRLNALWDLGRAGAVRFAWGHYFQSQRPQELDVQFGESEHLPAQRSEQWSLGWEGRLGRVAQLRVEGYRRELRDPQRRFETLFDPFKPLPQIAIDLVVIAPERATSEGVEVFLRGRERPRFGWWLSYVYSSVTERVDGRDQRRWFDQPHAINASLTYRFGARWSLSAVWRYHSGWPSTEVSSVATTGVAAAELVAAELAAGERFSLDYEVGPFYAERYPDYHSLDLRLSRDVTVAGGRLSFFLDIQNLYDHRNARGLEIEDWRLVRDGDRYLVDFDERKWFGRLPSVGLSWSF